MGSGYVPNYVLASYFTGQVDPQRGRRLIANQEAMHPLVRSIRGGNLVVLHDCFEVAPPQWQRVEAPDVAYRQRWLSQWQWLRGHPEVDWVWCVDATDVTMLRSPWESMEPGVLYVGWEPSTVDIPWMRKHSAMRLSWLRANRRERLLNCGVVGGDRDTVMALCQAMTDQWVDTGADALHEMVFFNIAARQFKYVTGPQVTTEFRARRDNGEAWWMHK